MSIGASMWRMCAGKVRHETREAAEQHAQEINRPHGRRTRKAEPYRCDCCGGYHVGRRHQGRRGLGERIGG